MGIDLSDRQCTKFTDGQSTEAVNGTKPLEKDLMLLRKFAKFWGSMHVCDGITLFINVTQGFKYEKNCSSYIDDDRQFCIRT
jgi:hypothetical protein